MSSSGSGSGRRIRTTTRYVPVYLPLTAFVDWANAYCVEDETACCAEDSDSGSGSGSDSGSGGEPVTIPCCENTIPQTLFMTWSDGGQVVELTWNGSGWASGEILLYACGTINIVFNCSGVADVVGSQDCSVVTIEMSDTLVCDPFSYTAEVSISGAGCGCSTNYAIAIGPTAPSEPAHPGGGGPPPPPPP